MSKERHIFDDELQKVLKGLEGSVEPSDWDAIASQLDGRKRRVAWWWASGAAIITLLISAGIFITLRNNAPEPTVTENTEQLEPTVKTEPEFSAPEPVVGSDAGDEAAAGSESGASQANTSTQQNEIPQSESDEVIDQSSTPDINEDVVIDDEEPVSDDIADTEDEEIVMDEESSDIDSEDIEVVEDEPETGLDDAENDDKKVADIPEIQPNPVNVDSKWEIGVRFTPSLAAMQSVSDRTFGWRVHKDFFGISDNSESAGLGYNFGIHALRHLPKGFYFSAGVLFSQKVQSVSYDHVIKEFVEVNAFEKTLEYRPKAPVAWEHVQYDGTNTFNFVEIPLKMGKIVSIGNYPNLEFRSEFGVSFMMLTGATGSNIDETYLTLQNLNDVNLRQTALGSEFKAGVYYTGFGNLRLGIEPGFGIALTSVNEKNAPTNLRPYSYGLEHKRKLPVTKKTMRRWLLHIALICFATLNVSGQAFGPVGEVTWSDMELSVVEDHVLYAVAADENRNYHLHAYSYEAWSDLGVITGLPKQGMNADGEFELSHAMWFSGTLFIGGRYTINLSGNATNHVVMWDGSSWSSASSPLIASSADLNKFVELDNKLYLTGIFGDGTYTSNLLLYDGGTWSEAGNLITGDVADDFIADAFSYENKIYMSGGFTVTGYTGTRNMVEYDADEWKVSEWPPFLNGEAHLFASYDTTLVLSGIPAAGSGYINYFDGQYWIGISAGLENFEMREFSSIVEVDHTLWITGDFLDKQSNDSHSVLYWDGFKWNTLDYGYVGDGLQVIEFDGQPVILGEFDLGVAHNAARLYPGYALISGSVYHDENNNCIADLNETGKGLQVLELNPGGYRFVTNSDGSFNIPVEEGSYTLSVIPDPYWKNNCGTIQLDVDSKVNYTGNNFGLNMVPDKIDLVGHLTDLNGWVLRRGMTDRLILYVKNIGTKDAYNVEVSLFYDQSLTSISFQPPADSDNGSIAAWTIDEIKAGEFATLTIDAGIPSGVETGVTFRYEINPAQNASDENNTNNRDSITYQTTTGQFVDPINKSTGNGPKVSEKHDDLLYKIRFQNVGTGAVERIVVLDTLDEDIYIDGVWMDYFSEATVVVDHRVVGDNYQYIYKWIFENAMLPDSASDPLGSVGFVDLRVAMAEGFHPENTEICNEARVRFDNQETYPTNEVCVRVGTISTGPQIGLEYLSVLPNPAGDKVTILNPTGEILELGIFSLDGRLVESHQLEKHSDLELSLGHLNSGVYLFRAAGFAPTRVVKF